MRWKNLWWIGIVTSLVSCTLGTGLPPSPAASVAGAASKTKITAPIPEGTLTPPAAGETATPTVEIALGLCPSAVDANPPDPAFLSSADAAYSLQQKEKDAIRYLDQFGAGPVAAWLAGRNREYLFLDVNRDETKEIGFPLSVSVGGVFYVFGCRNGGYKILFAQPHETLDSAYRVELVRDGNRNGYPEITFWVGAATQGMHAYEMIEWGGAGFRSLLRSSEEEYLQPDAGRYIRVEATGSVDYRDEDGDGVEEFVADTGFPVGETYRFGLPFQNVIRYHAWDGTYYSFDKQYYGPPVYRFQAVQNGDRLSSTREFALAASAYRQAIEDAGLEWWTEERHAFLQEIWKSQDPTPSPPVRDPREHPSLAAYAAYRLLLIDILQGDPASAESAWAGLNAKYPESRIGHAYAEMASAFWEKYQSARDITLSCQAAAVYAENHPREILGYLGNGEYAVANFGIQSLTYTTEIVCPF